MATSGEIVREEKGQEFDRDKTTDDITEIAELLTKAGFGGDAPPLHDCDGSNRDMLTIMDAYRLSATHCNRDCLNQAGQSTAVKADVASRVAGARPGFYRNARA